MAHKQITWRYSNYSKMKTPEHFPRVALLVSILAQDTATLHAWDCKIDLSHLNRFSMWRPSSLTYDLDLSSHPRSYPDQSAHMHNFRSLSPGPYLKTAAPSERQLTDRHSHRTAFTPWTADSGWNNPNIRGPPLIIWGAWCGFSRTKFFPRQPSEPNFYFFCQNWPKNFFNNMVLQEKHQKKFSFTVKLTERNF